MVKVVATVEILAAELVRTQQVLGSATAQLAGSVQTGQQDIAQSATTWSQDIERRNRGCVSTFPSTVCQVGFSIVELRRQNKQLRYPILLLQNHY